MGIKITVDGWLGKDPYVQTIGDKKVVVLSLASRRPNSRHADWITGTVWNERLGQFVLASLKKGDKVLAFGVLGKLGVYYGSDGKAKPALDFFVNTIGFSHPDKETDKRDGLV
jgi:hypothetical protein